MTFPETIGRLHDIGSGKQGITGIQIIKNPAISTMLSIQNILNNGLNSLRMSGKCPGNRTKTAKSVHLHLIRKIWKE